MKPIRENIFKSFTYLDVKGISNPTWTKACILVHEPLRNSIDTLYRTILIAAINNSLSKLYGDYNG